MTHNISFEDSSYYQSYVEIFLHFNMFKYTIPHASDCR